MENLSKLKTECRASVTKYFEGQRLSVKNKDGSKSTKGNWSSKAIKSLCHVWLALTFLVKVGSFLVVAVSILYFTETTRLHEPTDRYIFGMLSERLLPVMKTSRFVSLTWSLHKLPQFQDAHSKACFLVNPFFEFKDTDCRKCKNVGEVVDLTGLTQLEYRRKYHHNGIPFVIKNSFPTPINSNNLKELLYKNLGFESLLKDKYSHIQLEINPTNLSRALREIFPAPDFLPPSSEVHYQQHILYDGPWALEYDLPMPWYGSVILLQARGRRVVKLLPVWHCRSTCSSISVVLEPGQTLYYSLYFWRAASLPISNMKEAEDFSITNLGSFYYPAVSKFN